MRAALPLLLLAGCAPSVSPVLVNRMPAAELLVPCESPPIPSAKPTAAEAATDWVNSVKIALDCKAKDDALIKFIVTP